MKAGRQAQADGLPTEKSEWVRARMALVWQHVAQWSLPWSPSGGPFDGAVRIHHSPSPYPSGRLFGCGLDESVCTRPRPFHFRISKSSGMHDISQLLNRNSKEEEPSAHWMHHTETTPYHHRSPCAFILCSLRPPSQTLTRSTHAYAESGSLAICLHLDNYLQATRDSFFRPRLHCMRT
jgi:hypothetical protein